MKPRDKVTITYDPLDDKNVGRKAVIMELTKTKLAKIRYENSTEITYVMIEHIRAVKS
jgi:hypothetical protein